MTDRGGSLLERARQLYRMGTEGSGSSREQIEIRCERGAASNLILDKAGRLTDQEMAQMQMHPEYSYQILRRVAPFQETAKLARDHHERLDRGGY